MTADSLSLQDILSQRQRASSAGRQAQIAQFRNNAALPAGNPGRKFIFNVHGVAGTGKTFLAHQLAHAAEQAGWAAACTDETAYDLPDVMAAVASSYLNVVFDVPLTLFSTIEARQLLSDRGVIDGGHEP